MPIPSKFDRITTYLNFQYSNILGSNKRCFAHIFILISVINYYYEFTI